MRVGIREDIQQVERQVPLLEYVGLGGTLVPKLPDLIMPVCHDINKISTSYITDNILSITNLASSYNI